MVGEYEIDKILVAFGKKWLVIDVPNTKFKVRNPYKNPGPWGGVSISNYMNMLSMNQGKNGVNK